MPFEIVRNNIVNMHVDAIVNTANPRPVIGSGVDTAIHEKAGAGLLEARKAIGDIQVGEARITPAFSLNAKYVIHTVGPVWKGGVENEVQLLHNCYLNSLNLALEHQCESIAFPLISTGNYGFPKDLALQTAIRVISSFSLEHEMQIYLVVFDKTSYGLSEKLFKTIENYIDDNYAAEAALKEYESNRIWGQRRRYENLRSEEEFSEYSEEKLWKCAEEELLECAHHVSEELVEYTASPYPGMILPMEDVSEKEPSKQALYKPKRKLEDLLKEMEDTFSENLFRWIIKKDKTNPEVYKKANMDRKLFSKILNNKDYKPSKINAVALAIALELNLDETKDFIGRAGYALTHSSRFDIIVEWFILQGNYNIFEINEVLFAFDQPCIGG